MFFCPSIIVSKRSNNTNLWSARILIFEIYRISSNISDSYLCNRIEADPAQFTYQSSHLTDYDYKTCGKMQWIKICITPLLPATAFVRCIRWDTGVISLKLWLLNESWSSMTFGWLLNNLCLKLELHVYVCKPQWSYIQDKTFQIELRWI